MPKCRAAKGLVKTFIKVVASSAELVGSNLGFPRRSSDSSYECQAARNEQSEDNSNRRKANLPLNRTVESRRAGAERAERGGTAELQNVLANKSSDEGGRKNSEDRGSSDRRRAGLRGVVCKEEFYANQAELKQGNGPSAWTHSASVTPPTHRFLRPFVLAVNEAKASPTKRNQKADQKSADRPYCNGSCSDTDSSSELGTPEYSLPSWPSAVVVDTPSTLPALQATDSSPQHAFKQSQRDTTRINTSPLESSVNMMAPPRELDAASLQLDRLAIQRPARLERLSSAATTATARPSSPSDDSPAPTATQSPRHSQASDRSSLSLSSRTILSKPFSLDSNVPIGANPSSPSDAWRSLLPKTDPYFAPDSQPRSSQQFERPASPQCLPSTSSTFDIDAYADAKSSPRASTIDRMSTSSLGTSRTSFSSITSGFSAMSMSSVNNQLSRQSHDSVRSDSWTSFLPEGDRYLTSRNADVSASQIAASPSLESPSLSDRLDSPTSSDSDDHRSAFLALKTPRSNEGASSSDSDSAARRHASFSSVESDTVKQRGATRAVPAIVRDGARPFAKSASQSFERTALPYASSSSSSSSAGVMSPPSRDSFDAPRISSELSSSKLEDDTSERDSWPTSRVDRSGCLGTSSTGSSDRSTPETSSSLETLPTPKDKSSLATVPPRVVETSDSTVPASQADLPATTTTTPTITKKFTTTTGAQPLLDVEASRASNKARSEADVDVGPKVVEKGDDKLQCSSTKARASSCSISTPVSSMDHPFLDRRPAPSGTNLVIEQERFRYVVLVSLPGFSLDCITVATKRNAKQYTLHVVADKYDAEGGGHFERRVTFSEKDCDMVGVRSEFDGNTLRVIVPRILSSSRSSSANSARF